MTKEEKEAKEKEAKEKEAKEKEAKEKAEMIAQDAKDRKAAKDAKEERGEFLEWREKKEKKTEPKPENLSCPKCGTIWDAIKKAWKVEKPKVGWLTAFFNR